MTTIGVVGSGNWGRHIVRDLRALGCAVPVVARSDRSRDYAAGSGATEIVPALAELPAVDGLVVATPTVSHAVVVAEALARGVPVFVEKPLTIDSESAGSLAAEAGDRLFVMDKWRYHPGVEAIGEIARSGELGRVVGLQTLRIGWGNPHPDVDAVWILAPHDLSIALEVLGAIPPAAHAAGEWLGGELWGLRGLLGDRPWLSIEVSSASHRRAREVRLLCEDGVAWLGDAYADRIGIARTEALGSEPEWRAISTELPLLRELRAFVEHLQGGVPPRSSAAEGAEVVRRIEELRRLAGET